MVVEQKFLDMSALIILIVTGIVIVGLFVDAAIMAKKNKNKVTAKYS